MRDSGPRSGAGGAAAAGGAQKRRAAEAPQPATTLAGQPAPGVLGLDTGLGPHPAAGGAHKRKATEAPQPAAAPAGQPAPGALGLGRGLGSHPPSTAGAGHGRGRGRGRGRATLAQLNAAAIGGAAASAGGIPAAGQAPAAVPLVPGALSPLAPDPAAWAVAAGLVGVPAALALALVPTVFTVGQRVPGALYAHPAAWAAAGGAAAATAAATAPAAMAELVLALLQRAEAAGRLEGVGLGSGTLGSGHALATAAPQPAPAAANSRLWLTEWRPPQGYAHGGAPPLKKKSKGAGPCPRPGSHPSFLASWLSGSHRRFLTCNISDGSLRKRACKHVCCCLFCSINKPSKAVLLLLIAK